MNNLCLIPARGGSKRIPRKNIKDFLGKPIITYSIEAAVKSRLFNEIMVSTDDQEIKNIAVDYGAKVPFLRSKKNSDDFATTMDVIKEVVDRYKENGVLFNNICCLYPTAPFVTEDLLIKTFKSFSENTSAQGLKPVVKYSYPIQRSLIVDKKGFLKYKFPKYAKARSQDLENIYHDAGQFYWWKRSAIDKSHINTQPFIMNSIDCHDIDTEEDWLIAELKFKMIHFLNSKN